MERLRCRAGPLGLALALAVVGQLLSGASGQGLFFLVRPETAYAPLGTSASFTCSGTSSTSFSIFWRRNGIQFSTIELVSDGISYENSNVGSVVSSELTVPTSVENNGTSFTCLLSIPTVVSNLSNPVQLIILDVPSPPFDLSLRSLSDTQLNLSWSSPPSFPGVPLSFTVTVTRTRDSLLIDTVPGITDTQFLFNRPSVSSDCEEYQFSVSAINAAGTSDPRQQSGGFPEDPSQAQITNAIVDVSSNPAITVSFQPLADSCRFSPITSYTASIFTTAEVLRLSSASVSPDMREIVVNATSIELNAEFLVRVTANTEFGSSLSDSRTIYTTDVQSVSIMPLPGDTHNCVISCYFAVGTLAQGCQIELLDSSGTIRLDLQINRASGSLVANTTFGVNLGPGDYTVRAYDWEQDMSTTRSLFVATAFTLNDNGTFESTTIPTLSATPTPSATPVASTNPPTLSAPSGGLMQVHYIIIGGAGGALILLVLIVVLIFVSVIGWRRRKVHRLKQELYRSNTYEECKKPRASGATPISFSPTHSSSLPPLTTAEEAEMEENHIYQEIKQARTAPTKIPAFNPLYDSAVSPLNPLYASTNEAMSAVPSPMATGTPPEKPGVPNGTDKSTAAVAQGNGTLPEPRYQVPRPQGEEGDPESSSGIFVPAYEVIHLRAAKFPSSGGVAKGGVANGRVELSANIAYGALPCETAPTASTFAPLPNETVAIPTTFVPLPNETVAMPTTFVPSPDAGGGTEPVSSMS